MAMLPDILCICTILLIVIMVLMFIIILVIVEIFDVDLKKSKISKWLKNKLEIKE